MESNKHYKKINDLNINPKQKWILYPKDDISPENWPPGIKRSSGQILCDCGQSLDDHYQPARSTCPTLVIDCLGNWWKL